jgi:nucleoid-associated protein YgaU
VAALGLSGLALVGVAGRAAASGGSHDPGRHGAVGTYVVRPGDTLWGIAARMAGPTADLRPLVGAIAALNHSDGRLVPGQALKIPRSA